MYHQTIKEGSFTLSKVKPGSLVRVISIQGGRSLRQRLLNLGVVPGADIKCIRGGGGYPMVLEVQSAKVVLGAGMSACVFVSASS